MEVKIETTKIGVQIGTEKVYPVLEDLIVVPSEKQQHFKSHKYGYDNVTVKGVEGETLEVTPKKNEQSYSGVFTKVDVNAIESEELNVTPSEEEQLKEGLFDKVSIGAIQTEEKVATLDFSNTDTVEVTPIEGSYLKKVTINKDENLVPENIAKDVFIDGILGTHQGGTDTSDATATAYDIISPATAYVNGEKIEGAIIPSYSDVATGVINKNTYLSTSSYMTIGFSRDNKYAIKLDYSTQELIVYNVGETSLTELKRQPLSTFISGTVSYQGCNSISFSDYGACESDDCAYVFIGVPESKSFITVFNRKTLEFNYSVNGYANFYAMNLTTTNGQAEPIVGKLYFTKYINLCVSYVHDNNNYKRFYSFALNKNGTITKTLVNALNTKNTFSTFDVRPTVNGDVLQLTLNNTGWNYDNPSTSFTRYLIYITNNTSMTLVNTTISHIFSPNGSKATDGTKIYESYFNLSSKTYSVTELFSLPKTYTIINFITENMFLAWTTNKQIILVTLDYDNKTSTETIITLTYPLTQSSTFFKNIINVVSKDYLKISVEIEKLLISLNIKGRDYYLK